MGRLLFLLLTCCLIASNLIAAIPHQTELKYLIPDLSQIPKPVLQALENGDEHPDLIKRGLVVQEYLLLTSKNIIQVFRVLNSAGIPFGTDEMLQSFLETGVTQEIRLMRKYLRYNKKSEMSHHISFLGGNAISRLKLETPVSLSKSQQEEMIRIFSTFKSQVSNRIQKLHFEINGVDKSGKPLLLESGERRTIEVDIFFNQVNGVNTPIMIDGEVRFLEDDQYRALQSARRFRESTELHPRYFGRDLSSMERLKSRNIASSAIPGLIAMDMEESANINRFYISRILAEFSHWMPAQFFHEATSPQPYSLSVRIKSKVLFNAEPFGFGPTSVIGEIFPYLRDRIMHLGYVGTGHTLDLQKQLPYDEVYEYGSKSGQSGYESFRAVVRNYDVFITACDFEAAEWAKSLGLKVVIYDPLTWYWKEIPETVRKADLYLSQNFFGVMERLKEEKGHFPESRVVPPVVSKLYDTEAGKTKNILLVNFGGLSNPYMKPDVLQRYISTIIQVINKSLKPEYDQVIYLGSKQLSEDIGTICDGCTIKTVRPQQVQKMMASSSMAIMTSGLGNIYEAAAAEKHVLWLPPANDSQGQQVKILDKHQMLDFAIDWHDILPDEIPIDYFAPQQEVLEKISSRIEQLNHEAQAEKRLAGLLKSAQRQMQSQQKARISALTRQFSFGGAKFIADNILQWLREVEQQ